MKNESIFTKHKYRIICKCGHEQVNEDDSVVLKCKLVKTNYCKTCESQYTEIPTQTQIFFTHDGKRIYL